jgi:hypothetical protein
MQPELKQLLQAIFNVEDSKPVPYEACLDDLPAYVDAELAGRDAKALFPRVRQCLDEYEEFRAEYEELRALMLMEQHGALRQPPFEPVFDFSFLDTTPEPQSIWQTIESTGREVLRLVTEIEVRIRERIASFSQLPPMLSPQLVALPSARGEGEGAGQQVTLPSDENDLAIDLQIGPAPDNQAIVDVRVMQLPEQRYLSNVQVTVRDERQRMLTSEQTDENGRVILPSFKPGTYFVEVRQRNRRWEIPLTFS